MSNNQAAWIPNAKEQLKVDSAPYSRPDADEVVIKNGALAINPVEWKVQDSGMFIKNWPNILGCDVAGEVVEVGSDVKNVQKGQRVLGHAIQLLTNEPKHGALQLYTVVPALLVAPIPDSLSFEEACVLPLSVSTAAAGLYQKDVLGLSYPTERPVPTGTTLLVWGGSTSVGCSVIQLAKASGLKVFATASEHNFDLLKELGADKVFDYKSKSITDDIIKELKGEKVAGAYDSWSTPDTVKQCAEILKAVGGGTVATVLPPPEGLPSGVEGKGVFAPAIWKFHPEVGEAVYQNYLANALKNKKFLAKPDPLVVGTGLEKVQAGFDRQKEGVSAKKVVVKL